MEKNDIKLLDCTLRDGGYINEWKWGYNCAKEIIRALVKSNVDMIEVGFLRNIPFFSSEITVSSRVEDLNTFLPKNRGDVIFSAMAMCSNYDISNLCQYCGDGIKLIRVTAHDYDIDEGLEFARKVQEKGYLVSVNPINIMGYSDEMLIEILKKINQIHPYQFSIVDTFGSMKHKDLNRIVSLVDNNLEKDIRVSLHLHENMSLSCSLAQRFIEYHMNRPTAIDGSLMGMGRVPGNLPIELIADYMNEYCDKNYDIDYMMDVIQDYVSPIKVKSSWGYLPEFFLSAKYNLHRNYAEYLLTKGDITCRDINHILSSVQREKATVYDEIYIEKVYQDYKNNIIDDKNAISCLREKLEGRKILLLAPGKSIVQEQDKIKEYIEQEKPIVFAVNFIPKIYDISYVFFSNNKRYQKEEEFPCEVIVTSNLSKEMTDYIVDYNSLVGVYEKGNNSLIMLLRLLQKIGRKDVVIAGADGYSKDRDDYYDSSMRSSLDDANACNRLIASAIKRTHLNVLFLTDSKYSKGM